MQAISCRKILYLHKKQVSGNINDRELLQYHSMLNNNNITEAEIAEIVNENGYKKVAAVQIAACSYFKTDKGLLAFIMVLLCFLLMRFTGIENDVENSNEGNE
jgi:hypothetical protein